ncbi:hypothetical protein GM418_16045 [Maribellus comscasis]|uniref:Uncharacterized protein n=1 Tax=Maribellus comscasis TaxID=2681766 RepID=A0A6I6JQ66_9BACT|nr:hypothetical protein [Maribellus comscasis]QGY45125.1 hypothetical protein GM418_16045 [Maribellus comscasis]
MIGTSDYISAIAIVISLISFFYTMYRHRQELGMKFEQRKQEIRQLIIETDVINQKIFHTVYKIQLKQQFNEKLKSYVEKLVAGIDENENDMKILKTAFSKIGRSSSKYASLELEKLLSKVQSNLGEVKKNYELMGNIQELISK